MLNELQKPDKMFYAGQVCFHEPMNHHELNTYAIHISISKIGIPAWKRPKILLIVSVYLYNSSTKQYFNLLSEFLINDHGKVRLGEIRLYWNLLKSNGLGYIITVDKAECNINKSSLFNQSMNKRRGAKPLFRSLEPNDSAA